MEETEDEDEDAGDFTVFGFRLLLELWIGGKSGRISFQDLKCCVALLRAAAADVGDRRRSE